MADYIFTMKGLTKVHPPDKKVVENVYLSFLPGAKIGVIGPNGSGKSSLLRIMAGEDTNFTGEAWRRPSTTVGHVPQEPDLGSAVTVIDAVNQAVEKSRGLLKRFEDVSMKLGEPMGDAEMNKVLEEQGRLQDQIDAADLWNLDNHLELAMDALRLPPADAEIKRLSGGEKRRVALCKVLLEKPDLLLLDEPTNHLDAESVAWLEQHLEKYPGCVVSVTHDRYFLDNVAEWILELDRGSAIPFKGNYSAWLEAKQTRLDQEEKADSARKRKIAHEIEWVRASPRARQAKSKARLGAYEQMVAEQGKQKRDANEIRIPAGDRLGDLVIEAIGITKAYGDKLLIDNLSFKIPKNAIVGIIGPNGAGKTTLFRMIMGQEKPDSGQLRIGDSVKLAYIDQSRDSLVGENNVWKEISDGADTIALGKDGKDEVASRAYVSWFNFRGSDQQKLVKFLSGGERNRVHLAKMIKRGGNVLLLDEPTNDLDTDTLAALEDLLDSWAGTLIVVSHDRYLVERVADTVLAVPGDGTVLHRPGGVDQYLEDRRAAVRRLAEQEKSTSMTQPSGGAGAGENGAAGLSSGEVRQLKKDLQRLDKRMESLRRKQATLHDKLASVGADYETAAELNAELKAVAADLEAAELEWLDAAEALES